MASPADGRPLRVLFVAPHPVEGPSTRFRILQFLPYLAAHGVDARVRPFLSSRLAPRIYRAGGLPQKAAIAAFAAAGRVGDVLGGKRFDVVYILREAFPFGPPFFERALKAMAGRMIFDFDDAIYAPSTAYDNPLDRFRDWSKTGKVIGMADHVVAGSRYLADYARRFTTGNRISVLPTVVDTDIFRPPASTRPGPLTVGWIGTPRGTSYLHPLRRAMEASARALGDVKFVFVGAEPFDCGDAKVEFRNWSLEREVADIQSFDIGIMPLPDDEEARGKCGFKLIEYMSVGMPVICSPVGANRDIVEHGRTGFFATAAGEWESAIVALGRDENLRRRMGAMGRAEAERAYSLRSAAPRFLDIVRGGATGD